MRGILFPNSNILFDVQSNDPETFGKKEAGGGASSTFSGSTRDGRWLRTPRSRSTKRRRSSPIPGRAVHERQARSRDSVPIG